jgi:hypothetical protein
MTVIDLKSGFLKCHTSAPPQKEMADEYRSDDFFSIDRFPPHPRVSQMHRALLGQLQDPELLMLGSVSMLGFCTTYLSRKSQRHPGLPQSSPEEALPHGYPQQSLSQHSRTCQPGSRLAHLRRLIFLTNNFSLPALTITKIYKCRWQIELFFKWIKQHLRIKAFYGTAQNAVKTQIWIAISVYVLVAIVKKRLNLDQSLYTILQILSLTLFEKTPILQVLSSTNYKTYEEQSDSQLKLFD